MKSICLKADLQENCWVPAPLLWSQCELQMFTTFPGQTLKCQYLLISVPCGDCAPCNWVVKNTLQHFRTHLEEAAFSNPSLLWSIWHLCSSASARITVYWSEWEGRTAIIHTCEEAQTLRHVLSSLSYDFQKTQYNALELRQHFMVCHLTQLKVWADKNGVRPLCRLMAPHTPYILSDSYEQSTKPKQFRY